MQGSPPARVKAELHTELCMRCDLARTSCVFGCQRGNVRRIVMRRLVFVVILFLCCVTSFAQTQRRDKEVTIDDLISGAEAWAKENLDDDVLELLDEIDRDKVRAFLMEM